MSAASDFFAEVRETDRQQYLTSLNKAKQMSLEELKCAFDSLYVGESELALKDIPLLVPKSVFIGKFKQMSCQPHSWQHWDEYGRTKYMVNGYTLEEAVTIYDQLINQINQQEQPTMCGEWIMYYKNGNIKHSPEEQPTIRQVRQGGWTMY